VSILSRVTEALSRPFPSTLSPSPSSSLVKTVPAPADTKASSTSLLPRGAYGPARVFFSSDGGRTITYLDGSELSATSLAFAAYWFAATRWRAQKIAEAPLMVVAEDQETGDDEWLPDHELAEVLDQPSPDYDMGELLETTSHYLDNGGAALWVKDTDKAGRVARIAPFARNEFEVKSDGTRMFATFDVQTAKGLETKQAEDVCYFRDMVGGWKSGKSRLDVAASALSLGASAMQTIRDLLKNSVWPSGVSIPDKDWNPPQQELDRYKADLAAYGQPGRKGEPFVLLGGGSFTPLSAALEDLVPGEILNRVESVVASVSGVPAIVLQFQVGLENSPWSQMADARRMAYTDTIAPSWRKLAGVLTRQMLRPVDEDPTHFIRFDPSKITDLQVDQESAVSIAVMMGRAASLNERRTKMGLEPLDDPKADEIPELTPLIPPPPVAGAASAAAEKSLTSRDIIDIRVLGPDEQVTRDRMERKRQGSALLAAFRTETETVWQTAAHRLLKNDADAIAEIVTAMLVDVQPEGKGRRVLEAKARGKERVLSAVSGYLRDEGRRAWARSSGPLMVRAAERSSAVVAADLSVSFSALHPHVLKFASRESGRLVTQVTATTKEFVADTLTKGLEAGDSTATIASALREGAAFSKERATLIARTETTGAFAGAPTESLAALGKAEGRRFTKTWSTALDDRVRDEHVALEGETVDVDAVFSNGLGFPQEPNCRCTLLYSEVDV